MTEGFASTPEPPYYAVIFTSQRTDGDNGYEAMAGAMFELALKQPGGERRDASKHLSRGVDDMPPAICALRACYKRTHEKGILRGANL